MLIIQLVLQVKFAPFIEAKLDVVGRSCSILHIIYVRRGRLQRRYYQPKG